MATSSTESSATSCRTSTSSRGRGAGDAAPGDTKGQGLNGVWFVVRGDGSLVQSRG